MDNRGNKKKFIATILLSGVLMGLAAGIATLGIRWYLNVAGSTLSGASVSRAVVSASEVSSAGHGTSSGSGSASGISDASHAGDSASAVLDTSSGGDSSDESTEPDVPYKETDESVWASQMPADGDEIVPIDHAAYTYEEMRRDLYLLSVRYPDLVTVDSLGETADGRQVMEAVIGNPQAANHIVVQYSLHAREYINTLTAMKSLELYLMNYQTGTYDGRTYADLFSNVCIHMVPMTNPDGVTVAQSGLDHIAKASLRKSLEETYASDTRLGRTKASEADYFKTFKANARGVDLNKNFDVNWENYVTGVPYSSTDCYKGLSANSEAETKALISLVDRINCVCFISYHAAGQTVYWNYGLTGDLLAANKVLGTMCTNLTGYAFVAAYTDSSKAVGGCSDYMELIRCIPSVTIETGSGKCPVAIDQFPKILAQNIDVIPAAAEKYAG